MSSAVETEKLANINMSYQRANESLGVNQDSSVGEIKTAIDHIS